MRTMYIAAIVATGLFILIGSARAAEIVGEDFSYPDGNIDGTQNGGTSLDANNQWTSAWTFSGDTFDGQTAWIIDNGRAYTPSDNKELINAVASRSFTTDVTDGTTMYVAFDLSVEYDKENGWATLVQFLGGALQIGVRDDQIRLEVGSTIADLGEFTGGDAGRLTARIVFNDTGDEAVTVWLDAADETAPALDTVNGELGSLNLGTQVDLVRDDQDQNLVAVDNLQIGTDFASVPEPASMALLGLGGLALLRKRR